MTARDFDTITDTADGWNTTWDMWTNLLDDATGDAVGRVVRCTIDALSIYVPVDIAGAAVGIYIDAGVDVAHPIPADAAGEPEWTFVDADTMDTIGWWTGPDRGGVAAVSADRGNARVCAPVDSPNMRGWNVDDWGHAAVEMAHAIDAGHDFDVDGSLVIMTHRGYGEVFRSDAEALADAFDGHAYGPWARAAETINTYM